MYRRGTLALLTEEIEFQFRRTFKQQQGSGSGGGGGKKGRENEPLLSIDEMYISLKGLEDDDDEATNKNNNDDSNKKPKKSKKKRSKSKKKHKDDNVNNSNNSSNNKDNDNVNKVEYILQTIFQSHPFQRLLQKIHKKFHHLADEIYSIMFLSELQKCCNRFRRSGTKYYYGSAFGDTDAMFGSFGTFFGMDFLTMAKKSNGGCCFQANPPFASVFIERMCHRMHEVLMMTSLSNDDDDGDDDGNTTNEKKEEKRMAIPLMFVIFVPAWYESIGWKALSSSPYLTKHVLLSQKEDVHYYAEGTQHRRRARAAAAAASLDKVDSTKKERKSGQQHRIASFDTSVFFLQNDAAREKWGILSDGGDESMLKAAFAMKNPTTEAVDVDEDVEDGSRMAKKKKKSAPTGRKKNEQSLQKIKPQQCGTVKGTPSRVSAAAPPAKRKKGKKKQLDDDDNKMKGLESSSLSKKTKKKKKLMAGGQDEMSILQSMGIL
ncbi:hypothetical protein ACHAXR_006103 [Thalassiosira sp. AJA248-18]